MNASFYISQVDCNTAFVQVKVLLTQVFSVCISNGQVPHVAAWPCVICVPGGVVSRQQAAGQRQQRQHPQSLGHQDREVKHGPTRPRWWGESRKSGASRQLSWQMQTFLTAVSWPCRFTQWTGALTDREWPAVGKTNASECKQPTQKPSSPFVCVFSPT